MAVAAARRAAMEVLLGVEAGRYADDLLHGDALRKLTPRDAALATALVMAVLRWQLVLDAAIIPKLKNAAETPEAAALALRLGLAQLWFLDRIPPHAALSESVELAREFGAPYSAGMVNAVLRRLQQRESRPVTPAVAAQAPWMLTRWRAAYGDDAAMRIAEGSQREPAKVVRAPESGEPAAAYLRRAAMAGDVMEDGARVQDEGSQLVAELAAASAPSAVRVLDACAAPGGKTQVLAELLPGAAVVAVDASAGRLRTMERLLPAELRERVQLVHGDASKLPDGGAFAEMFNLVLCDAPCSGTGTLAHNPEIRLRLGPRDIAKHAERQRKILAGLWPHVAPGGVLVYSTCSLEAEENSEVVRAVMTELADAALVPVGDALRDMQASGALLPGALEWLMQSAVRGELLQTLPGVHACDGFFVAVLRKR